MDHEEKEEKKTFLISAERFGVCKKRHKLYGRKKGGKRLCEEFVEEKKGKLFGPGQGGYHTRQSISRVERRKGDKETDPVRGT